MWRGVIFAFVMALCVMEAQASVTIQLVCPDSTDAAAGRFQVSNAQAVAGLWNSGYSAILPATGNIWCSAGATHNLSAPLSFTVTSGTLAEGCNNGQIARNCYTGGVVTETNFNTAVTAISTLITDGSNFLVIGFALFCLIAGFGFGWKVVQRGTSQ